MKAHAPHCRIIFTVYEMKRLGRDAAELTALADHLTAHGLVLEMLAGPLPGMHDPSGPGRLLFAFFAAMAETERENIRESALEGLDAAARKGKHSGRPPVITEDMLHTVLRRRANGESVEQIQPDLIILTGKRKGQAPSVASIYRALAESASDGRAPRSPRCLPDHDQSQRHFLYRNYSHPEDCGPGRPWKPGPPVEAAASKPIRIGYARCSTAQQELQQRLDSLRGRGWAVDDSAARQDLGPDRADPRGTGAGPRLGAGVDGGHDLLQARRAFPADLRGTGVSGPQGRTEGLRLA
ncbi:recombinase family protein [Streptomyces lydicus]